MKYVKISYSVDLEEVPEKILSLMSEANKVVATNQKKMKKIAKLASNIENVSATLEHIEELRADLYKMDLRLADCVGMLEGYQAATTEPEYDEAQEPPPETSGAAQWHMQTPEYDQKLDEKIQEKVMQDSKTKIEEQLEDMKKQWESAKVAEEYAQKQAFSQLPEEAKKSLAPQMGGTADIMKSMMKKMMTPPGSKGDK